MVFSCLIHIEIFYLCVAKAQWLLLWCPFTASLLSSSDDSWDPQSGAFASGVTSAVLSERFVVEDHSVCFDDLLPILGDAWILHFVLWPFYSLVAFFFPSSIFPCPVFFFCAFLMNNLFGSWCLTNVCEQRLQSVPLLYLRLGHFMTFCNSQITGGHSALWFRGWSRCLLCVLADAHPPGQPCPLNGRTALRQWTEAQTLCSSFLPVKF